ncbi:MAG: DUF1819 domain-containing protein [Deltaproteobacteria bacterium]|nr:MAG: DUF1819 domain-containing protein [Deltaproteobacteria bacterium]
MTPPHQPAEATALHTRLLKCALAVDESRAYWREVDPTDPRPRAHVAFDGLWFGPKRLDRVEVLLANMRGRFDAFPEALSVLRRWRTMPTDTRRLVCHWHLQLADPLYRRFTGAWLPARRALGNVSRDPVVAWVDAQAPGRWTTTTRVQFASKLLGAAAAAGLIEGGQGTAGPRALLAPRVPDEALAYLLHALRGVHFAGTLVDNPYLESVGLVGPALDDRLRTLGAVTLRRLGDSLDVHWAYPDLAAWAAATLDLAAAGGPTA